MKYLRTIIIGLLLLLLFIELQIDFCIGFGDTGFVVLLTFILILLFLARSIIFVLKEKKGVAIGNIIFLISVLSGTFIGTSITKYQVKEAKIYVEGLSNKINIYQEKNGCFPKNLIEVGLFEDTPKVSVGLLNKRPLYYRLNDENNNYVLWFPYVAFMTATYSNNTKRWIVDD